MELGTAVVWLILFLGLVIAEAFTMGLTTIWFAGGALVAGIVALIGLPLPVQILLFLAVSVVLLVFTRPIAARYFNRDRVKTNAESLVGCLGTVLEPVDNLQDTGLVRVNGQEWTARCVADGVSIPEGAVVHVRAISGVKLIVEEKA